MTLVWCNVYNCRYNRSDVLGCHYCGLESISIEDDPEHITANCMELDE